MTLKEIEERLRSALSPTLLEVRDDSPAHAGHFQAPTTDPSHVSIKIASDQLKSLLKVKQHQAIYRLFQNEINTGEIHAFRICVVPTP
jgi:BolA protein